MRIAVVIPCYRVTGHILEVVSAIGPLVSRIYCVDDACPDASGDFITENCHDPRVVVLRHEMNRGVGGAVMTGYAQAIREGMDVIVKIDGDGQMDPRLIHRFARPICQDQADYTKGNRFFFAQYLRGMPLLRVFGNGVLSFLTKLSSGYWNLFDPTNGYTAIHARIAARILDRGVSQRYFFESDLLFHLYNERAVICDVPMRAHYADEESNLRILGNLPAFLWGNLRNSACRIVGTYFVRDFGIATVEIAAGLFLLAFGMLFGGVQWVESILSGSPASAGTVMLAGLPTILGIQMLLAALNYDILNIPRRPLHPLLRTEDEPIPDAVRQDAVAAVDGIPLDGRVRFSGSITQDLIPRELVSAEMGNGPT